MRTAKDLTRQSLSAFLSLKAERSRRCGSITTQGFVVAVSEDFPDDLVVEYEPGTRTVQRSTPERLLKIKQATLSEYREHLKLRYQVTRNNRDNSQTWDKLLVRESGKEQG